jgi:D-sedoheptulose 7-phosphate isomerase
MVRDFIGKYFDSAKVLLDKFDPEKIEAISEIVYQAWLNRRQVFIAGNGGSASTATHLACDLSKCTIIGDLPRLRVFSLVDNIPLTSAWTNDNGFETVFEEQLKNLMDDGDVLIVFSVHGGSGSGEAGSWSQNIPRAVKYTQSRGGKVIGFSGFGGGLLGEVADECVVVEIDQEPLGTPLVESLHSVLAHLLTQCVRVKMQEHKGRM